MKINKAKVTVTSLAIAAVAAMVGSISGTVAWFQYSTRASVAYTAATAHASESIQIRLADGEWGTGLEVGEISDYIKAFRESEDTSLRPVTTGEQKKDGHLNKLLKSPIYQYGSMKNWEEADKMDYVRLPLEFRALDIDGADTETTLSKKVWLTRSLIEQKNGDTKKDISDAIRVHLDSDQNNNDFLFSKNGNEVTTIGELDLNGDTEMDRDIDWKFDPADPDGDLVLYGVDEEKIRGQFASDDEAIVGLTHVPENYIYLNTNGKDYVLRNGTWEEVNVGNDAAMYGGEFADDDAAYAGICKPEGKIYYDGANYRLFSGGAWTDVTAHNIQGTYADDEAARLGKGVGAMTDGKTYKNSTDGKLYIWEGNSWKAFDDAASFAGEFADNDAANFALHKAAMVDGTFYHDTTHDKQQIWIGGEWKDLDEAPSYKGAFASDYAAEDSLGVGENFVEGDIYFNNDPLVNAYKCYNGSAWVVVAGADYAGGDAAILGLGADPADGTIYKKSGDGSYLKLNAGVWGAIDVDTTQATGDEAILALDGVTLALGDYYTVTGGTNIRMYNGTAWDFVPTYANDLAAAIALDPVDEGTIYYDNTVGEEAYRIFANGAWADADYDNRDADGDGVDGYADEHIAELAINHKIYTDGVDEEYLKVGDLYYNTTDHSFKELKYNRHDRYVGWEEKQFLAESYAFDSTDIIANDTNPRNITGGKELGKTVIAAADAAALADLKAAEKVQEGDLAFNEDDKLQYIFDGTDWKVNADEEVNALPVIASLDEEGLAKSYHLTVADAKHAIGIYEVINGEWVKRDGRNLRVDVTIYLEGWQELEGSALWGAKDYVDAQFNVGLRFSGEPHVDHK